MCNYFSCIIDRKFLVYWNKATVSHEELVKEAGLKDDKLKDRDFVRIEITPKDAKNPTRNKKDWNYKVDEPGTLPGWYVKNQKKAEAACWAAWKESVKINLALAGEEVSIKGQFLLAVGAKVKARGNSTVKAGDNSTVEAGGNSTVKAWGNSTVKAWGNSTVEAWGNSTVEAWGNSTVEAWGNSTVKAWDNSTVKAGGNSTVEAWGNSYCFAEAYWAKSVKIELKSNTATVRLGSKLIIGAGLEVERKKVKKK